MKSGRRGQSRTRKRGASCALARSAGGGGGGARRQQQRAGIELALVSVRGERSACAAGLACHERSLLGGCGRMFSRMAAGAAAAGARD